MSELPGLDGPHSPETTRAAAARAAEAILFLNYATGSHIAQGLRYPSDVDTVVQELAILAQRLPQLLDQLGGWTAMEQDAGRLAVTHGPHQGDPDEAVTQLMAWLDMALTGARGLYRALDQGHQVTATLASHDPEENPDA